MVTQLTNYLGQFSIRCGDWEVDDNHQLLFILESEILIKNFNLTVSEKDYFKVVEHLTYIRK